MLTSIGPLVDILMNAQFDYRADSGLSQLNFSRSTFAAQVKTQDLHFRSHANYFLLPWKIPEKT